MVCTHRKVRKPSHPHPECHAGAALELASTILRTSADLIDAFAALGGNEPITRWVFSAVVLVGISVVSSVLTAASMTGAVACLVTAIVLGGSKTAFFPPAFFSNVLLATANKNSTKIVKTEEDSNHVPADHPVPQVRQPLVQGESPKMSSHEHPSSQNYANLAARGAKTTSSFVSGYTTAKDLPLRTITNQTSTWKK